MNKKAKKGQAMKFYIVVFDDGGSLCIASSVPSVCAPSPRSERRLTGRRGR
jgi:hypothetical protein